MSSVFRVAQLRCFFWSSQACSALRIARILPPLTDGVAHSPSALVPSADGECFLEGHLSCLQGCHFGVAAAVGYFWGLEACLIGGFRQQSRFSALPSNIPGSLRFQRLHLVAESEGKEDIIEDGEEEVVQEPSPTPSNATSVLLEKIRVPRDKSVLPALCDWINAGNSVGRLQIKAVFTRLEFQGKFAHALEVSQWVIKEKPFELLETHYARWLYYVGKIQGLDKAEEALSRIPLEFQKDITYCKLFDVYLECHKFEEAKCLMKRMKDQGIPVPTYVYNNLITYYDRNALKSRIPILLNEMKDEKITFNRCTYNILMANRARDFDIEGLEEVWELMKADPSVKPDCVSYSTLASAYLFAGLREKAGSAVQDSEKLLPESRAVVKNLSGLILLYGSLGKEKDVERVYRKIKELPGHTAIPVFVDVLEACGEAGSVELAEQVLAEMLQERGWHHLNQFNTLLGVYCRNGLMEKAEEVLKNLVVAKHRPNAMTYSHLLVGYLKTNQVEKVTTNFSLVLTGIKGLMFNWEIYVKRSWLHNARSIIELFAQKGNVKDIKLLLGELEAAKFNRFPKAYNFVRKTCEKTLDISKS